MNELITILKNIKLAFTEKNTDFEYQVGVFEVKFNSYELYLSIYNKNFYPFKLDPDKYFFNVKISGVVDVKFKFHSVEYFGTFTRLKFKPIKED